MTAANTKAAIATPESDAATAQPTKSKNAAGVVQKTPGSWSVDPDTIAIRPGFNIRFDMGDIEEMAASIDAKLKRDPESGGLIHPLGLKRILTTDPLSEGGKFLFEVIRGNRRTLGIRILRKKGREFPHGVPATILDNAMDMQTATLEMFVENNGKPLTPLEEAAGIRRLRDGDKENGVPPMSLKAIEKATGFSDNKINSALALLEADDEVIAAVKDGKVSATTAKEISVHARGDKAKQRELITAAKSAKGAAGKRELKKKIEEQQRAKHAKKGRTLKMRALDDKALGELGASLAGRMVQLLADARKAPDFDLRAWVKGDDKLALAASFGALEAMKAAAGMKINLEF
jgi:hypothetical protein